MKFLKNSKGFTLAEMLIVMAVVVVLAAATMPAINSQIEIARETNDIDAIRAAYIDAYTSEYLVFAKTGAVSETAPTRTVKLTQKDKGWTGSAPKIDGVDVTMTNTVDIAAAGNTVTFTFEADGAGIKIKTIAVT